MKINCTTCDLCLALTNGSNPSCPSYPCHQEENDILGMKGDLVLENFLEMTKNKLQKKLLNHELSPGEMIELIWKFK